MVRFVAEKRYSHQAVESLLAVSKLEKKFTNDGPVKRMLEEELSTLLCLSSDKRVVCIGNGTASLHALLYAYEERAQRSLRWLTPSFTFPTPVVGSFSAKVGAVDKSGCLSPDNLLNDVDGVIITTLFGSTSSVEYWTERCRQQGKICILDNASSPYSFLAGTSIMSHGDASFSSLHHTKFLGVGEGGFVVVRADMADAINRIACFGFDSDRNYRPLSSNFKMSDISAAFILSHIRGYDISSHVKSQEVLVDFVLDIGASILGNEAGVVHGNLPVVFKEPTDKSRFAALGVEANKYYRPLTDDASAWKIYDRIINFPLHDSLCAEDLSIIMNAIKCEVERS